MTSGSTPELRNNTIPGSPGCGQKPPPHPSSCSLSFPSHQGPGMRAETAQGRSCGTIPWPPVAFSFWKVWPQPWLVGWEGSWGQAQALQAPQGDGGRQQDQPGTESTPVLLRRPGRNSQVGNGPQEGNKCHSRCNESALVPKKPNPALKRSMRWIHSRITQIPCFGGISFTSLLTLISH